MTIPIDITLTIAASLPSWPGDPALKIERVASLDSGDVANISRLEASLHIGTHVDAPLHFLPSGKAVDQLDLSRLIGPCLLVELEGHGPISAAELEHASITPEVRRLLLKTSNSRFWEQPVLQFHTDYRALSVEAARWLVERNLLLVGIDALSIEPYQAEPGYPVHCSLLEAGMVILEGLRLAQVEAGWYQLLCLPLKVAGGDGAPARAVLLPLT